MGIVGFFWFTFSIRRKQFTVSGVEVEQSLDLVARNSPLCPSGFRCLMLPNAATNYQNTLHPSTSWFPRFRIAGLSVSVSGMGLGPVWCRPQLERGLVGEVGGFEIPSDEHQTAQRSKLLTALHRQPGFSRNDVLELGA